MSIRQMWRQLIGCLLFAAVLIASAGCASTTPPATEAGRVAGVMRDQSLKISNLRRIPVAPPQRAPKVLENWGFDIPGIDLNGKPAGTIRIYRDARDGEADRRLFGLLGAAGPTTKLDYVTVAGTRELILDYRLPKEVAQQYITVFRSVR